MLGETRIKGNLAIRPKCKAATPIANHFRTGCHAGHIHSLPPGDNATPVGNAGFIRRLVSELCHCKLFRHKSQVFAPGMNLLETSKNPKNQLNHLQCNDLICSWRAGPVHALRKNMITNIGNVKRSGLYYLITTLAYINQQRETRFDILGGVIVVGLVMVGVSLVRFVLVGTL
jgi:hypothetical protein